jgi:hypothetical protein
MLALLCAAESIVWDFKGAPDKLPAGTLRKWAKIAPEGLVPTGRNPRAESGYRTEEGVVKAPTGAFRITVDIVPAKPVHTFHRTNYNMMLFDTLGYMRMSQLVKYDKSGTAKGIQLALIDLGGNKFIPVARFGCGNEIATFHGETVHLSPGVPARIVLDYDALSRSQLIVNGKVVAAATIYGVPEPGRFAMIGSALATNSGFTGAVERVELEYLPVPRCALAVSGPRVLRQGEGAPVRLEFSSGNSEDRYEDLEISGTFAGFPFAKRAIKIDNGFELPVETRLMIGTYPLEYFVSGRRNGEKFDFSGTLELRIVPPAADGMPVRLWTESEDYAECRRYAALGFDHVVYRLSSHLPRGKYSTIVIGASYADLDNCASAGFSVMDYLDMTHYRFKDFIASHRILDRSGKPRSDGRKLLPDCTDKKVVAAMWNAAFVSGEVFGPHPAFYGSLVNTERRDHTVPALDKRAHERYRGATGRDIPPEVDRKLPPSYGEIDGFPADRVISDDDPLLAYYRWFWKEGDGMNALNGAMGEALKEGAGRRDLVVMYDPAVRVPPVWGSGGNVDLLNQWVYAYPEPFRVAGVAGEMRAMAEGRPGQKVGIMTQMIVKRHELAVPDVKPKKLPRWVKWEPKAPYMTTPAGLLREATWAMLARHVDSIMYYGAGAIQPPNFMFTGLRFINPEGAKALSQVFNGVVKPVGKMLRMLPEREADTAVYESLASCLFAGRGGWGWGREWPSGMLMYRANLAPKVLYDESILNGGLEGVKVLFMPHCDVLTAPVAKEIEKFQSRGGIVVADRNLAPAITPDIVIGEVVFSRKAGAKRFKMEYKRAAAELLEKLHGFYTPFVSADMEFLTFPRKWKSTDYLFVVNDARTYGGDFGAWRQVMEKGAPHKGRVLVRRRAGAVYELSRGGQVPFLNTHEGTLCELDFNTNDGRILMFLDEPIASVALVGPKTVTRGEKLRVRLEIRCGAEGRQPQALFPVSFTIQEPGGNPETVYDCAVDGVQEREFLIPLNAPPGEWKITAMDRASGFEAAGKFTVKEGR